MIANNQELKTTQERISYFHGLLEQMRLTARPEHYPLMASGYRAEIERMQQEVLDYLCRHAGQSVTSEAG